MGLLLPLLSGIGAHPLEAQNTLVPEGMPRYEPTGHPDRIILTFTGDPSSSQAVSWRTGPSVAEAVAEIAVAGDSPGLHLHSRRVDGSVRSLEAGNGLAHHHTVTFTDLRPNTLYAYRVRGEGTWIEWFQFRTASQTFTPFSFLYFGDAQNAVRSHYSRTIRQAALDRSDARVMVHAGDLVNLREGNHDDEWGEWFEAGGWLHGMIPSIPAPGNHEYMAVILAGVWDCVAQAPECNTSSNLNPRPGLCRRSLNEEGSRMRNDVRALRSAPLAVILAATLGLTACGDAAPAPNADAQAEASPPASESVRVAEAFMTPMDTIDDVDSPAAWRAPEGNVLLLATAKGSHVVMAYDGETGSLVGRMGREGSAPGEFLRPNGIFVHDDLVYIVERDNRRVQVLTLPEFQPVAIFGDDVLLKPYGITGFETDDGILHLWITDDFDVTDAGNATWENRVKRFAVEVRGFGVEATVSATRAGTVGDAEGPGRLVVVESILADPAHDRLLIADEDEAERTIKVFRLDGSFTGEQLGGDVFRAEPEGIALWQCDTGGYLLMADQSYDLNQFHVFDRESLEHLGTFAGEAVANTDGVAVLNGPAGRLGEGAFYAIHADQGAVGFAWSEVASALGLRLAC